MFQHSALRLDPERGDDQGSGHEATRAKREHTDLICDWQDHTDRIRTDQRSDAADGRCETATCCAASRRIELWGVRVDDRPHSEHKELHAQAKCDELCLIPGVYGSAAIEVGHARAT